MPRQDEDGNPYIAYYDRLHNRGFIWDGKSTEVQVTREMGEEVIDTIDVEQVYPSLFMDTDEGGKPDDWLQWFKVLCDWYVDRMVGEALKE